ncbi:uncharacterized protein LOC134608815 isoform X3 [Pelobates fuscus]|uniref:uncharacterized protein LOC134608815 isoform X3 n=1 Tax=Pelobates fuscus TaxID=191477 RepID=UPI002FE4F320
MEDMSRISASVTVFLLYVLLWLTDVQCINFSECPKYVTDSHLGYLDNMIESQMESSCAIDVKLLKKGTLSDYCYTRGLIYQLGDLIRKNLKFRNNSVYQNNTAALLSLYNDQITKCVLSYNDGNKIKLIKKPNVCDSDIESLSPVQILEKVKQLFIDAKNFRIKYHTDNDCEELYERECENDERKAESKVDETHRQKNLNLIIVAVLGVLGIMFLCGLLYGLHYKRKYRMLKRQLNRPQQDPESPEERPLNNQEIELEEL